MSCQCGCGRLLHLGLEDLRMPINVPVMPAPRVAGKPHICRWWNQWIVASDPAAPVDEKWLAAVRHADHLDRGQ